VARYLFPLSEMESYGRGRWVLAAILFVASPVILLWG
jgi:hypothetical protein